MKEVVKTIMVIVAVFGITAFGVKANADDYGRLSADYAACKKVVKETFGEDVVVKVKRYKKDQLEMFVSIPGSKNSRFVAVCDRETLALVSGK